MARKRQIKKNANKMLKVLFYGDDYHAMSKDKRNLYDAVMKFIVRSIKDTK